MAVKISVFVFLVVTSCGFVFRHRRFGRMYLLRFMAETRLLRVGSLCKVRRMTMAGKSDQSETRTKDRHVVHLETEYAGSHSKLYLSPGRHDHPTSQQVL
jgi:hypothetical protein